MDNPLPLSLNTSIALHQSEAEKLFAGAVLLDEDYARQTCGWLDPDMFRDPKIADFWRKVLGGKEASEAAMEVSGYFEFAGYMNKVASLYDIPAIANTISLDRYLSESAGALSSMARCISERDAESLKRLAQAISTNSPVSGGKIPDAVDVGAEFISALDDIAGRSELTGIPSLDAAVGGLEKQTLTILAARPSMGKSSLGIQICKWKAEHEKDKRIGLFTLEMNRIQVWARMACGELKISWRDVRAGRVSPAQIQAIKDKSSELMDRLENRMLIDDTPLMGIDDIWRKVSQYRFDFVVVDHLGLVRQTTDDEEKSLAEISRMGKVMAKQFDIPVLCLYQLNRKTEGRDNKRPVMSDLRGSGRIEENADNVFFLYRPDYYEDASTSAPTVSDAEIIVAKFRDGVRNIQIQLKYHLDEQVFYPVKRA